MITVHDRTAHSAEVTPEQAIAYVVRTVGPAAEPGSFWLPFWARDGGASVLIPKDYAHDWPGCAEHIVEQCARREMCQPSEVLRRMAAEPVGAERSPP